VGMIERLYICQNIKTDIMKTFKDLEFRPHPLSGFGRFRKQAEIKFNNDYGVSVITGGYGNDEKPYELAIILDGGLCYNTGILDDVAGWLTEEEVTDYMLKVQKLN